MWSLVRDVRSAGGMYVVDWSSLGMEFLGSDDDLFLASGSGSHGSLSYLEMRRLIFPSEVVWCQIERVATHGPGSRRRRPTRV